MSLSADRRRRPRPRGGVPLWATSVLAMLAATSLAQESGEAPAYLVVVHPEVVGNAVTRTLLRQIFLKQVLRWGDGQPITAVDQSLQAPVRASFSAEVLGQTPREVLNYWRDKIRSGMRPPMVKETDAEVLAHVAANPGAIGYVRAIAELDGDSVKVLAVTGAEE